MPRPNQKQEKAKDLKGTLLRIFKSLKNWKYILVISCILSMTASILSTIAPNKLADVTDVISEGIKPKVENIEVINKEIFKNIDDINSFYKLSDKEKTIYAKCVHS